MRVEGPIYSEIDYAVSYAGLITFLRGVLERAALRS